MRARIPKQGGAQDMNAMIRQAQKMQDKITELQEDIEARDFTASVGGGAVEVVVTGKKNIKSLKTLGYSLEEIRDIMEDESHFPSVESLEGKIIRCEQEPTLVPAFLQGHGWY